MIVILYKTGKGGKILYYTVHDRQLLLDSPYALCSSWRVGLGRERERTHRFASLAARDEAIRRLVSGRIKDGYRLLYSFNRSSGGVVTGFLHGLAQHEANSRERILEAALYGAL
jgi:hypothetical protein